MAGSCQETLALVNWNLHLHLLATNCHFGLLWISAICNVVQVLHTKRNFCRVDKLFSVSYPTEWMSLFFVEVSLSAIFGLQDIKKCVQVTECTKLCSDAIVAGTWAWRGGREGPRTDIEKAGKAHSGLALDTHTTTIVIVIVIVIKFLNISSHWWESIDTISVKLEKASNAFSGFAFTPSLPPSSSHFSFHEET